MICQRRPFDRLHAAGVVGYNHVPRTNGKTLRIHPGTCSSAFSRSTNATKNHLESRYQQVQDVSLNTDLTESAPCRYGVMSFFRNDDTISRSLQQYGEWAQSEIDVMNLLIGKGDTVVDAGAFIGTHSLAFAGKVGNHGRVYSFEPRSAFFEVLQRNIDQNKLKHRVKTFNVGLFDRTATIKSRALRLEEGGNLGGIELDVARRGRPAWPQ
jgi:Met-10+ like-protein